MPYPALESPIMFAMGDEFSSSPMESLPPISPHFFVPRLCEKPQNPIMDTLKLSSTHSFTLSKPALLPELSILVADTCGHLLFPRDTKSEDAIWTEAMLLPPQKSNILSWDRLRHSRTHKRTSTGFLSEQDSLVFAAARYHVQPHLLDPDTDIRYVTQSELLDSLEQTVLGTASLLHIWDSTSETFVQVGIETRRRGLLLVDGKDEIISRSLISRFLTIGTLLRRLEIFVTTLRSQSPPDGSTIHAFSHALSVIHSFLQRSLSGCAPSGDSFSNGEQTLTTLWMQYGQYEDILVALSALYNRDERIRPEDYPPLDYSATSLLSRIYNQLSSHIERQSPRVVIAIFAFILSNSSRNYLDQISRSVGFGGDSGRKATRVDNERDDQYAVDLSDDGQNYDEVFDNLNDRFPTFFPPELVDVLAAAQKSLILLRAAQPDHMVLHIPPAHQPIHWFWTPSEIEGAWQNQGLKKRDANPDPMSEPYGVSASSVYKADLAEFQVFDLEPGGHFGSSAYKDSFITSPTSALQVFLDSFPNSLPPITPTLSHLTSLVFEPIVSHASALSRTLLSLFLSPSADLHLQGHLQLLRSYLLLTAPSFKSRLAAALFSDSEDCDMEEQASKITVHSFRRKSNKKKVERTGTWAVGIAPALLERETWPPVGADLSFFLRTVIVDSFEANSVLIGGPDRVWEDVENRLGFAIRDLPVTPGHDKWLNPLCIEALDFLYLDYKPPHPVDVVITPEILSKYQRIFTFLLRLMRVENALTAVFRMTRATSKPLLPTLTSSHKLLMHFRFIAHSFLTRLSGYVFDTAIGGNFDPFLARLSSSAHSDDLVVLSDVFSLSKAHSMLLDDILTACLLRSGQRAVGDLLRDSLDVVLEFAVLVGEVKRGRLQEYQAAPQLEGLFERFRAKLTTFTKVLKGLVDKTASTSQITTDSSSLRKATGGKDALAHLLVLSDLGDRWTK